MRAQTKSTGSGGGSASTSGAHSNETPKKGKRTKISLPKSSSSHFKVFHNCSAKFFDLVMFSANVYSTAIEAIEACLCTSVCPKSCLSVHHIHQVVVIMSQAHQVDKFALKNPPHECDFVFNC